MPSITASAPGKIILFGEHAVVYGQPALAVPVTQVAAKVSVTPRAGEHHISSPQIDLDTDLDDLPAENPLAAAVRGVQTALRQGELPGFHLEVHSTIPVAAGLGSGAAVSAALIRAFSGFLGQRLPNEKVNALAYEIEKIHHGTPSGIDNTVVTYARPVYFVRGQPIQTLHVPVPFTIVIADTGIPSPTAQAVGDVRRAWKAEKARYEKLFTAIGWVAQKAHHALENGQPGLLGPLMDKNQALLREIGVSSPEIDGLVNAACAAGAAGAKLSGGGRGGNMIALVPKAGAAGIAQVLTTAGAVRTIITEIGD